MDFVVEAPHPGFSAPRFTLETIDGDLLSLNDIEDRPVLVFFWASWCSVCKRTMPGLQSVYDEYQSSGFEIFAINTTYQDSLTAAVSYYDSMGYTFPFLIDRDGAVSQAYKTHALPTAVLIGPDDKVIDVVIGSGMSEGYLKSQIAEILSNNP
jgi:peroxiredoxin